MPECPTMAQWAAWWLDEVLIAAAATTRKNYRWAMSHWLRRFPPEIRLDQITRSMVRTAAADIVARGYRLRSIYLMLAALRTCLGIAVEDGHIRENPVVRIGPVLRYAKGPRSMDIMTGEEIEHFLHVAHRRWPHLYGYYIALARTGARPGEVLGWRWEDVDLSRRLIHIRRSGPDTHATKTKEDRWVEVSNDLAAVLGELPRAGPWVFPSSRRPDRPWSLDHMRGIMKKCARTAGLGGRVTPHGMRHAVLTLLCSLGAPLPQVQRLAGHRDPARTLEYARHDREPRHGLVNLLDRKIG